MPGCRRTSHSPQSATVSLAIVLTLGATLLAACGPGPPPAPINPPPPGTGSLTTEDVDAWLDGFLPAALEREGVAGAIVSVVHDGEVVTERGFGLADTGAGGRTPVEVDAQRTLFRVGSISKLITATAVMRLVEDGDVDLDAPVADLLDFDLPTRFDEPITLRHLLSHTAGFEDRLADLFLAPGDAVPDLRESLAQDPPRQIFAPGTMPAYSNYGNALAAYVVERVSGEPFEEFAQREVFDRAGMPTASLAQPLPPDLAEQLSQGYATLRSDPIPFESVSPAPAGALSASAPDLSAFMLAHLDRDGEANAPRLLEPETLDLMQQPALGADSLGGLAQGSRMALGFYEQHHNGRRILAHGGDLVAFHAELQIYPEEDTGIFVALNSAGVHVESTSAIRDLLMRGFADRHFPDERPPPQARSGAQEAAAAAEGRYMLSRRSESTFVRLYSALTPVEVAADPDGVLSIDAVTDASGAPLPLIEVEDGLWQTADGQQRIAVRAVDGRVEAISIHPAFVLEPLPTTLALLPMVLLASLAVFVVSVIGWPIAALVRWRFGVRHEREPGDQRLRLAVLIAAAVAVLAVASWVVVALPLLSGGNPSTWSIRLAQLLTLAGVAGLVPATLRLVQSIRARSGWAPIARNLTLAVAFGGLAYTAVVGRLLTFDISY